MRKTKNTSDCSVESDIYWVGLGGLEPPTSRLSGVRSNQLSYRPLCNKKNGAEDGIQTRDPHLGKVVFYHWTTSAF